MFWKIASGDLFRTVFIPSVDEGAVRAQDTDHKGKCKHWPLTILPRMYGRFEISLTFVKPLVVFTVNCIIFTE